MFEGLKEKIGFALTKRRLGKQPKEEIQFNGFLEHSVSFAFLMPDTPEDFSAALDVPRYFAIHKKNVLLILNEINANRPETEEFRKLTFSEEDKGKLHLPRKEFKEKLSRRNFDVFFDLTFEKDAFRLAVVGSVSAKIKISCHSQQAELYANLILPCGEKNPDFSYGNLLNSLKMF
jgi:hypothetical protein